METIEVNGPNEHSPEAVYGSKPEGGCPECHTITARRLNYLAEGIWHDYTLDKYGFQFDPGDYECENGHYFRVDNEGKITNK